MRYNFSKIVQVLLAFCFVIITPFGCLSPAQDGTTVREINDMLGRRIETPAKIDLVLGTAPSVTIPIYMIAPDKLGGWNVSMTETEANYVPNEYQDLPVIGGWFGKESGNYETFLLMNPDIIFEGFTSEGALITTIEDRQQKLGDIPVVAVEDTFDPDGWVRAIAFIGEVLGKEKEAAKLIAYYDEAVRFVTSRVGQIPEAQRVKVYYAEGPAGLWTEPKGSPRTSLIQLCGGTNVAEMPIPGEAGRAQVSIEQILLWNPDVIIIADYEFYIEIKSDPKWQEVKAVKNDEIHLIPHGPWSWFDRPATVNQIVGIYWLAKVLYPETFFDLDLESKVREFYAEFYHFELTSQSFDNLVKPK